VAWSNAAHTPTTERLAQALASSFSDAEVQQLMAAAPLLERLAQSL
jgi:hypothetical protein